MLYFSATRLREGPPYLFLNGSQLALVSCKIATSDYAEEFLAHNVAFDSCRIRA
jgi:hypothetical protein